MSSVFTFFLLSSVAMLSRIFFRHEALWPEDLPSHWWRDVRAVVLLNHTSLYEPLMTGFAPVQLLWKFARHGVLPVAEKTMRRKVGLFFRFLVRHVVVVTRQRDHTWDEVLNHMDSKAVVVILPEGRMKRRTGLDSNDRPMTVRGGIADILEVLDSGSMLVLLSGGLHHIQSPGEHLPRVFRSIKAQFQLIDIADYRRQLGADQGHAHFKRAVVEDLQRRRDTICPALEQALGGTPAES